MAAGHPYPPPHLEDLKALHNLSFGSISIAQVLPSTSSPKNTEQHSADVPISSFQDPTPCSNCNKPEKVGQQFHSSTNISYADLVKGKPDPGSFKEPDVPISELNTISSTFQGKPAVLFPSMAKNLLVKRLKFVLVGKFSHGRPSLRSVRLFFVKLQLIGTISITVYDNKHLFLECSCKEDFYRIWMGLTWFIDGLAMRVFKWFPDFSPSKESSIAPVWTNVAGLPLYMFEKSSLLSIAKAAGSPITVDPRNINRSIVNTAWICIELDVQKQLVEDVWVSFVDENGKEQFDGFWIKFSYLVVPPFCSFCQHIGHTTDFCKRRTELDVLVADDMSKASTLGVEDQKQLPGEHTFPAVVLKEQLHSTCCSCGGEHCSTLAVQNTTVLQSTISTGMEKGIKQVQNMLASKHLCCSNGNDGVVEQKHLEGALDQITDAHSGPRVGVAEDSGRNSLCNTFPHKFPPIETLVEMVSTANKATHAEKQVSLEDVAAGGSVSEDTIAWKLPGKTATQQNIPANSQALLLRMRGAAMKSVAGNLYATENASDHADTLEIPGVSDPIAASGSNHVAEDAEETVGDDARTAMQFGKADDWEPAAGDIELCPLASRPVVALLSWPAAGQSGTSNGTIFSATADVGETTTQSEDHERIKHNSVNEGSRLDTKDPCNSKLSNAAAEFIPKWAVLVEELVEDKKQSDPVLIEKEVEQHGYQVTRYGSPFLSDDMGDIICAFKCKSVPNSPSRSRKQPKSIYDSPVYSPATIALCKKYGSDTSDDFDGSWEDYDC